MLGQLAPLRLQAQAVSPPRCAAAARDDTVRRTINDRVTVPVRVTPSCDLAPVIDSSTPGGVTARTLSDALRGRVPGVSVLESSGLVGSGARVRLRGGNGLVLPREPLLIIDGVRVDASQSSLGIDVGGQQPSRLDDAPLNDIDRIEILRGPAASALYGLDAAGGVIHVTTRTGRPGTTRWSAYVEGDASTDVTAYPSNSATGPPSYGDDTCTRAGAAQGLCALGALSSWSPLERASPFRTAPAFRGAANVSGGWERLGYFVGGTANNEQGVLEPNDARRYTARANLDLQPIRSMRVALRGSHIASRTALPPGDLFQPNVLFAGMTGNSADDPVLRGYRDLTPATIATAGTVQHIARTLGSAAGEWTPVRWLTVTGIAGREIGRRDESRTTIRSVVFADPDQGDQPVSLQGSTGRDKRTTLAAGVTATYRLASWLHGSTTVRRERLTTSLRKTDSSRVFGLFPPTPVTPVTPEAPDASSFRTTRDPAKVVGTSATQQIVWADRRLLDVGVRRDEYDRLHRLEPATYWSAGATWLLSDESFFPRSLLLGGLMLHARYGIAGDSRPITAVLSAASLRPPPGGSPPFGEIQPFRFGLEKVSEAEVGLVARMLSDAVHLGATWFRQRSTNGYQIGCCIGPFGVEDTGAWHTTGLEVDLAATLLRRETARWDARLTLGTTRNRYDGPNQSRAIDASPFFGGARRRLIHGYPIGGVWGRPAVGRDANGDGVIVPSEIAVQRDSVYLGSPVPTREVGLTTSVMLFRRMTLSAQVDYHGGFQKLNETEAYRCDLRICPALYDPDASIVDQTRAVSEYGTGAAFTEQGDFARLREVAVMWQLPAPWSDRLGMRSLAVTIAGRNLATFTDYSGLDPEVNMAGQSSFGSTELFTLPLPRTLLVRLDVRR